METFLQKIEYSINELSEKKADTDFGGDIGLCLFYANLYLQTGKDEYHLKLGKYMADILYLLDRETINCSIENGASAVLWLLHYLDEKELIEMPDAMSDHLKRSLCHQYKSCLEENNWVFLRGALGCLRVVPSDENYSLFIHFLDRKLRETPEKNICSSWYPEKTNLGLIYGVAGLLFFVNQSFNHSIDRAMARNLQRQLLDLILSEYQRNGFYPALTGGERCRMCWCYGELTMAFQLFMTGELMEDDDLKVKAIEIARKTTESDTLQSAGIIDSCLQHGAAGNYLLYKAWYKKTGIGMFKNAAELWLNYTKEILVRNQFKMVNRYTGALEDDLSLLTGLTGVGVAMTGDEDWLTYMLLR